MFTSEEKRVKMVKFLYIIAKGDFEITIKTPTDNKKAEDAHVKELVSFLRPSQAATASSSTAVAKQTGQQTVS